MVLMSKRSKGKIYNIGSGTIKLKCCKMIKSIIGKGNQFMEHLVKKNETKSGT